MKKLSYVIVAILVFPSIVISMTGLIIGGGSGSSDSGYSCTGDIQLIWAAEALDVTSGTPAGCSNLGDTTFASTAGVPAINTTDKSDGSNSTVFTDDFDYYTITASQNISATEGKLTFDFVITTWVDASVLVKLEDSSSGDYYMCRMDGADTPNIDIWCCRGAICTVLNSNYSEDTWYRCIYQWDSSKSNADQVVTCQPLDSSSPRVLTGSAESQGPEKDITDLTSVGDEIHVGPSDGTGNGVDFRVDRVIYEDESGL